MHNIRAGLWVCDLKLGVKAGLQAAAAMHPEALALDAFDAQTAPRELSFSGRRDLARHARNIAPLCALKADVGGRRLADRAQLDSNLARLRDAFQLAADLGAARVLVPAGFVPEDKKEHATERGTLAEAARALIGLSSSLGVRVCWLAGSEPPATLAAFLNGIDSSGMLDLDLNPGAFVARAIEPLDALNTLESRIAMARIADAYRGGGEAPFGSGDLRCGEVLIGLSALRRNLPVDMLAACGMECDRVAVLSKIIKRLKELRLNPV